MRCHVCNVAVGDGQRFCHECGEELAGVTDRTEQIEVIGADTHVDDDATFDHTTDDETTADDPAVPADDRDGPVRSMSDVTELTGPASGGDDETDWWSEAETAESPTDSTDGPTDLRDGASLDRDDDTGSLAGTDSAHAPTEAIAEQPVVHLTATEPVGVVRSGASTPASTSPSSTSSSSTAAHEPTTTIPLVADRAMTPETTDRYPVTLAHASPVFDGVDDVEEYTVPTSAGFGLRATFVFSLLAMAATLMASVADVTDIRTSRPVGGITVGVRELADIGTNLPVAGFIGASVMLLGGLLSCFGLRSGAGLAGGAGLSMAGWAAVTIGLAEVPIHQAEGITRNTGSDINGFTLAVTRDLGWILVAAVGIIGIIVFLASLRMAGTGGRRGLNPWIAAIGALGAVILAAGPLIPLGGATVDLNLGFVGLPRVFFAGRLVQLALIALTGIVGFLSVRTYGLGLAAGGLAVAIWLWVTTLAGLGDGPVGVGIGNLGTFDTTPHAVTTVGLVMSLVLIAVAATMAILNRPRT